MVQINKRKNFLEIAKPIICFIFFLFGMFLLSLYHNLGIHLHILHCLFLVWHWFVMKHDMFLCLQTLQTSLVNRNSFLLLS
jgi:hypothetical protein